MKWGYYRYGAVPPIEEFTEGAQILVVCSPTDYISKAITLEDLGWVVRDCIKTLLQDTTLQIGLFRKPFKGTVVNNVLNNGCGGINIDACRIKHNDPEITRKKMDNPAGMFTNPNRKGERGAGPAPEGRFPANLLLDLSSAKIMDSQSGFLKSPKTYKRKSDGFNNGVYSDKPVIGEKAGTTSLNYGDEGGASRYFYSFKSHSEMKSYLIKLIRVD